MKPHPLLLAACLFPALALIGALIGSVLFMAMSQSFGLYNFAGEDRLSLDHWRDMLGSARFWRSMQYSGYIAITTALLAVFLAYPLALWLRRPFPGSTLVSALLKAPLLVPGLVAAFLLVNIISYQGFFNAFMVWTGLWDEPRRLQNDPASIGVIVLMVWKQMPFAFLILSGSVQAIPENVLQAAQDLGARWIDRFRKVVLPLTASAMQAALILIFIGAAADFALNLVAGPTNRSTLSNFMYFTQTEKGDWNGAAVVAVMLMACSLAGSILLAAAIKALTRLARY